MGLKLDRKEIKLCTVSWWRTNADNRRMKIQRRVDTSIIVKYIMIFKMDGGRDSFAIPIKSPKVGIKAQKKSQFYPRLTFSIYILLFKISMHNIKHLLTYRELQAQDHRILVFNLLLSVYLATNQPKIYIIYRSSYKITMEQLQPNFQYFSTLAAQSRNLYRTDFDPPQPDLDHKKKIIELKLKNEFHHATDIFHKHKELEQATQKQPHQAEQESKTQEGQKKSGLEPEKKSFLEELIEEINSTPADKKNKISTFQKYENNADETKHQKKAQNTVALSNKLEMNLVEATRLGTIKASSIRKLIKPTWHPPYKLYRVIAGHQGWVRAVAVSPCNTFFATGSADRTIKFFDLASGQLKISLTGHINTIRGLQFSDKHPYLFSCGEDKSVKCWDLEMNKVIRNYHGHLSGVYCLKIHQDLSVLVTGGRDSTARVWDIRVRRQIHALTGHSHTVGSVITQEHEPHVVTGSYDSFVKLWDIGQGKCMKTLTNHKKSIRTMVSHPKEYTFATGASDNIKVWKCPNGQFLRNISGHNSIIDSMAINDDGVLVTGGDDGTMKFWDWSSGYNFQSIISQPQPGSIAAENAIFALTFDRSGSRLITGECDKTIKMYKEDENATEETHPIKNFKMEFY